MMTQAKINALIASSYNLHVGAKLGGEAMTPAKAGALPRGDRAMLCRILADKGGSELYSKAQAEEALQKILARQA